MPPLLLLAGGFCGAAVAGWLASLRFVRSPALPLRQVAVAAVALGSGVLAAVAGAEPTGVAPVDAGLRAVLGAGTAVLGAAAGPLAVVAAAALATAVAAGSAVGWVAPIALGGALAMAASGRRPLVGHALVAASVAQVALRLAPSGGLLPAAASAAVVLAPVVVAGAARLPERSRQRARRAALLVAAGAGVLTVPALAAAVSSRAAVADGLAGARAGMRAAGDGDVARAGTHLRAASDAFASAHRRIDGWWATPALAVPLVAQHLRAARAATAAGAALGSVGAAVVERVDADALRVRHGAVAVGAVTALEGPLLDASRTLRRAEARLEGAGSPWLVPPMARRYEDLHRRVRAVRKGSDLGVMTARAAPALFGADRPRRWFLAVVNPAESRASGGLIGNFGEIVAHEGRLRLARLGRTRELNEGGDVSRRRLVGPPDFVDRYAGYQPERHWQNVTLSPDFPSVAEVVAALYPQSGGSEIDGVISVDPIGLAALLRVIGPVDVAGWPEPLTADNAAGILLHGQYVGFSAREQADREDFLGEAAARIWERLVDAESAPLAAFVRDVGPAVRGKHVALWSRDPVAERLFDAAGASARLPRVEQDVLGVVTQNASGNKIDWFLRRSVDYHARVDARNGAVRASLTVRLRNDAPATGLPDVVIGGYEGASLPGVNKTILSIYTPWRAASATLDGVPLVLQEAVEAGRNVYSGIVHLAPEATAVVRLELAGRLPAPVTRYRLALARQPTVHPDGLRVSLRVAGGRALDGGSGWSTLRRSHAVLAARWGEDRRLALRLRPVPLRPPWAPG